LRRKSFETAACPVARSLDVIGDWWSLLIIRDALNGVRRFSEFQRSLGLAKNILTTRLKTMVAQGIMEVAPASDGSAYQEYVLTEKGQRLLPVLVALGQWGGDFLFELGEPRALSVDARNGRPLRRLEVRSEDGRPLGFQDVVVGRIPGAVAAPGPRRSRLTTA
jgi:DNA-binding HxlR family transcriptional regulator